MRSLQSSKSQESKVGLPRRFASPNEAAGGTLRNSALWVFALTFIFCGFILLLCGCSSCEQPGETTAQGRRRHERVLRINQQQMLADIDRTLLLDRPSKITDLRIP